MAIQLVTSFHFHRFTESISQIQIENNTPITCDMLLWPYIPINRRLNVYFWQSALREPQDKRLSLSSWVQA